MPRPAWFEDLERYWKEISGPSQASLPGPDRTPRPRDSDLALPIWGPPPTDCTFPDVDGPESIANPELPYFGIFLRDLSPREQHYVFATKEYWTRKYSAQLEKLKREVRELKKGLAKYQIPESVRSVLRELDPEDLQELLRAPHEGAGCDLCPGCDCDDDDDYDDEEYDCSCGCGCC